MNEMEIRNLIQRKHDKNKIRTKQLESLNRKNQFQLTEFIINKINKVNTEIGILEQIILEQKEIEYKYIGLYGKICTKPFAICKLKNCYLEYDDVIYKRCKIKGCIHFRYKGKLNQLIKT